MIITTEHSNLLLKHAQKKKGISRLKLYTPNDTLMGSNTKTSVLISNRLKTVEEIILLQLNATLILDFCLNELTNPVIHL